MDDRKRLFEYYSNKPFWDRMWEQVEQFELHSNAEPQVIEDMETVPWFSSNRIRRFVVKPILMLDFTMLHNQLSSVPNYSLLTAGNWTKKVIKEMNTYGYEYLKTINNTYYLG